MLGLMTRTSQITTFLLLAVLLIMSTGGCGRLTSSSKDEEKEAHYLAGKNRLYSEDFQAAKESFEKALRVIPKSAAAHLELGLLHSEQFGNFAEAVFHFERMLEYRPDHPVADRIKDKIQACKLALASEVTLPPVNKRVETEMKRLIKENESLTNKVNQLEGQIVKLQTSLARANVRPSGPETGSGSSRAAVRAPNVGRSSTPNVVRANVTPQNPSTSTTNSTRQGRMYLKHVLKSGETFYSLARRYRLDYKEIQKVNPGLRAKALKIGQVVNIPLSQTASAR